MKFIATWTLNLVIATCVLTLWSVLPPHVYWGLFGTGVVAAAIVGQKEEGDKEESNESQKGQNGGDNYR
jgi:hypothetical protein